MARVILDTGVLIGFATARLDPAALLRHDDVAVPAIVLTEYLVGVRLDVDVERRTRQQAFLDAMLTEAPVEDYTEKVVPHHLELILHARRQGRPRGTNDLIIAATARATGRTLVTTDAKAEFDELPGVDVRVLT